ncbi:MAG: hypothetical protein WC889_07860 [Myxococcota bacterium]|jgi:hypothetical protein
MFSRKLLLAALVVAALLACTPVLAQDLSSDDDNPMGEFTFTPKIGYALLGPQTSFLGYGGIPSYGAVVFNSLNAQAEFMFGGKGSAFQVAPFYMMLRADKPNSDSWNAVGVYLGYLYSWHFPTERSGVFYPGIGAGWGGGYVFGGAFNYGTVNVLRIPGSLTWYPSQKTRVALVMELSVGMQTTTMWFNNTFGTLETVSSYGLYVDAMVGVRFF